LLASNPLPISSCNCHQDAANRELPAPPVASRSNLGVSLELASLTCHPGDNSIILTSPAAFLAAMFPPGRATAWTLLHVHHLLRC
jgi:hypothetical protein